jgi:hypothetical protein
MQLTTLLIILVRKIYNHGYKYSVYFVQFWLSDAHNSAVNVTNTKWLQTAYSIEQQLTLKYFFPAYFSMEKEETKVKGLSEIRFRWIIFLLRLAGIPFKMKRMSTVYVIYMITVIICSCSTYLGMLVDVYIHWDDLGHTMTNIRVSIGMTNLVWIYLSCRYVTTLCMRVVTS